MFDHRISIIDSTNKLMNNYVTKLNLVELLSHVLINVQVKEAPMKIYLHKHLTHVYFHAQKFPNFLVAISIHNDVPCIMILLCYAMLTYIATC